MNGAVGGPGQMRDVDLSAVDLNLLVLLHALLEEASVTRAAERVRLSQPAMSHALRRIRRLFDDEILVRQGGQLLLTPRARQLMAPLHEVLGRTANLFEQETFEPHTATRNVSIAMTPSTAFVLGQQLTRYLAATAPGVRLDVIITMSVSDDLFASDGVDAILLSEAIPSRYPRERLYQDEWVVIAGTSELSDDSAGRLLTEWPHVAFHAEQPSRPYEVLSRIGLRYTIQHRVNDPLLLPHFVAGVERVAVHRRRVAELLTRTSPLWLAEFPMPIGRIPMDLVWNPWQTNEPFKTWMRHALSTAAGLR